MRKIDCRAEKYGGAVLGNESVVNRVSDPASSLKAWCAHHFSVRMMQNDARNACGLIGAVEGE